MTRQASTQDRRDRSPTPQPPRPSWPRRLGWLVLIWVASVLALAVAAGVMRLAMNAIGLHTN